MTDDPNDKDFITENYSDGNDSDKLEKETVNSEINSDCDIPLSEKIKVSYIPFYLIK